MDGQLERERFHRARDPNSQTTEFRNKNSSRRPNQLTGRPLDRGLRHRPTPGVIFSSPKVKETEMAEVDSAPDVPEVAETPKLRRRRVKAEDPVAEPPQPPAVPEEPKRRGRKAKEIEPPAAPSAPPSPPRRRAKRVVISDVIEEQRITEDSPPPKRKARSKKSEPPPPPPLVDTNLGLSFWSKMLDGHRDQQESQRRDHYAYFRIA